MSQRPRPRAQFTYHYLFLDVDRFLRYLVSSESAFPPSLILKLITSTVINIPTSSWQSDGTDHFLIPLIFDL